MFYPVFRKSSWFFPASRMLDWLFRHLEFSPSFLQKMARLSFRNMVGKLEVKLLLLGVEKSQLWWFGHLIKMHPGHLVLDVLSKTGLDKWKTVDGWMEWVHQYIKPVFLF